MLVRKKKVRFELTDKDFAYYNTCLHDWHLESGRYQVLIGASCADIRLQDQIIVYYDTDYTIDSHNRPMLA